jgi:hypothetical protein
MTKTMCSVCGMPIVGRREGLRHFGWSIAHQEETCVSLLHAEIRRLRELIHGGTATKSNDDRPTRDEVERWAIAPLALGVTVDECASRLQRLARAHLEVLDGEG